MDNSIHPRNWTGTQRHEKVNTRKAPNPEARNRLIAAMTAHCERHPTDRQSVSRLDRIERAAAESAKKADA